MRAGRWVRWRGRLLLSTILLALSACGPIDFLGRIDAPWDALTEHQASAAEERIETLRQKIRRQLETGNYRSALNLVRKEVQGGMPAAALADEYGQALNGLLDRAEGYREKGLPEDAGELFRLAHERFPQAETVAKRVRWTPPEIEARIEECAGVLMERGLIAYRAGDLDRAIQSWKMIQAFDPRHRASRKALETAEIQRANLEKASVHK